VSGPERTALRRPTPGRRGAAKALALAAALGAALPLPAGAVLGGDAGSVQADALRMGARRAQQAGLAMQAHTLTLADGSTITQYLSADGQVFALSWRTRFKPRLDDLLGPHFETYAQAARAAQRQRPGLRHAARLQQGDLVVEAHGHLNAHVGRAWLRSRLPAGVLPDALR
jgi:hypothetical protein